MDRRGRAELSARAPASFRQPGPDLKAVTLATEPTLSPPLADPAAAGSCAACAACAAALAPDQRYCLECGERRPATSEFLRSGSAAAKPAAPPTPPVGPPPGARAVEARGANPMLTVIAGVGVLLLAMGVGVLIGRAGNSGGKAAPAQVISVATGGATGAAGPAGAGEESFTGDWPSGTRGYTVQLQTLPEGSAAAAFGQAKSAATSKGASKVGALKESEYSSLSGSGYLVYSGVYRNQAEARKALGSLKSKFPGAKVIEVSNGGSNGSEASESAGGSSGGKVAPPSVLKSLSHAKGKSYEEQSKNLPNVIETG